MSVIFEVMKKEFFNLLVLSVLLTICVSVFSQNSNNLRKADSVIDSLKKSGVILTNSVSRPDIILSKDQAVKFLENSYQPQNWNDTHHPLRQALGQLIFESSHPPFDSSAFFLRKFTYDSIKIPWDEFYIWEPVRLKVANYMQSHPAVVTDSSMKTDTSRISTLADSVIGKIADKAALTALVSMSGLKDTLLMVVLDTLKEVSSDKAGFPFRYYNFPFQADSLEVAVKSLLKYLEGRDSSLISFKGTGRNSIPFMMNSRTGNMERFWLKNEFSDSVTVWLGNYSKDTIGLYLEKGVSFRRPMRQENHSEARIDIQALDNSKLLNAKKIIVKPQYWKYRSEASLIFSQAALSNWVKGGENSVSTALDVTGFADYENKALKVSSDHFIRLKLGFLKSGSDPVRKNLDLFETNSKLNHKAFGKFDFSAIMLFKTQVAPGSDYSVTPSQVVSKFLNPAVVTIGFGLDYKPNKTTSLNLSPLSYRVTFVTDTAIIDQTKYGIAKNRKSLHEPGASFMISNDYRPTKNLTITNRLQLFTNYIHNPQNVDIDWEMIAVANLNWFTDIRFNTHLIFDDDIKTVVLDSNKKPVLRPDGTEKKTARAQLKELLGLSFVFRF